MTAPIPALPAVAAYAAGVDIATLRKWAQRGHIHRLDGDLYDLREILAWLDRRDTTKVRTRRRATA